MIISMDESGSFVESPSDNSWCVVSAYVFSERIQSKSYEALKKLKINSGASAKEEIKLKNVSESNYFSFLKDLSNLGGVLFSVATDSRLNTDLVIKKHRDIQADKIRINAPIMIHAEGKKAVLDLADEIQNLPPQLYTQLQCQVELISDLLNRGVLYYAQRDPITLRKFKWRIDQKHPNKTRYEYAFERVLCPLLQTKSFREPMIFLKEADYSHMEPFFYSQKTVPKYIEDTYGKKLESGVNIGDIIRNDLEFSDSQANLAVQISDLLASGVRRSLRNGFSDNKVASKLLGSLMLTNGKNKYPIKLISFSTQESNVDARVAETMRIFDDFSRGILQNA
ncbi:DUF3800 domain-containing protein [Colwellia sp. Bg11-28]|uniref:DUF3800 domain-containing protein n=1 Tax=Colwellia sp. Bg11-28 TaxID=2058305 RepID=UPI000C34A524|nr:DUF3800 domain-containing protein [Colwellia sp. Bg11-28]PKH86920.1 hypothetical protein CXF79_09320 [Colwellia sp. Bg11-28]